MECEVIKINYTRYYYGMRLATYMKDDESADCVSNCGLVKLRINECISSGDQKKI